RTEAGSALPDVRQVTVAAPSVQPASPKTALILGAVGFVALALQIGATLFGELTSGTARTGGATLAHAPIDDTDDQEDEPPALGDLFDGPEQEEAEVADEADERAELTAAIEPVAAASPEAPPALPRDIARETRPQPDLAPTLAPAFA